MPKTASNKAIALVKIVWPKKAISTKRHPAFVSPSTMSVVVETAGSDGSTSTTIANNTGTTASTTLNIQAPVGNDTFVVSLYDQPQTAGETSAVGNELGQATVTQNIVSGQANTVNFTVDGIVSLVAVALASPGPLASVSGAPGSQTIQLIGDMPQTLTLTPLDADGNAIVAPGNAPAFSLAGSPATGKRLSVAPSASSANQFVVSPVAPAVTGRDAQSVFTPITSLELVATATDDLGPHTTNIAVTPVSEVFVGYSNGTGSKIAAYDGMGNPIALPAGAFTGVTNPVGLAYDPDDHWVLVADASDKVLAFDTSGSAISGFSVPTYLKGFTAIAYYNDAVGRVATHGLTSNPRRVLVADSTDGFDELSMTGSVIVRGSVRDASGNPITPTAVGGVIDDGGPSTSGAVVIVGNPKTNSVDSYDMVNPNPNFNGLPLAPPTYYSTTTPNGETPLGFAIAGFFENPWCPATSPSVGVLVATGSFDNVDVYTGQCQTGVYSGFTGGGSDNSKPLGANVSAMAIDYVNGGFYGVENGQNAIVDFSLTGLAPSNSVPAAVTAGSFTTPASSGLSSPTSIAVAF
ncbi:MAG TPA: hypothetical protein VJP85_07000 [Candidatus Baltobacteraceae bacterium]|nr:hypothetical protein [Candidatus Baltobacteraceae bacterium]